nr:MAG TPA: hypothetical protein [Bacteriophage sp.]
MYHLRSSHASGTKVRWLLFLYLKINILYKR